MNTIFNLRNTSESNKSALENRLIRALLSSHSILLTAILLIAAGYALMYGDGSTEQAFNPDIFSPRRIVWAPAVCLLGYLLIVVGILRRK